MNDDELQLIFLLHELGILFKRTGLPPTQKLSNLTESETGKGGSYAIWSASLAEELGLSQDIQNVILYHQILSSNSKIGSCIRKTNKKWRSFK